MPRRDEVEDLRHRVQTTRVPGMAPQEAPCGKPASTQVPVSFDGLQGILGTGRMEAAVVAKHWTEEVAVGSYREFQHEREPSPRVSKCRSRRARSARRFMVPPRARTRTTRSRPWLLMELRRKLSRTRRLTRFRSTARRRWRFATMIPSLEARWPLPRASSAILSSPDFSASEKTRLKSRERASLADLGKEYREVTRATRSKPGLRPRAVCGPSSAST